MCASAEFLRPCRVFSKCSSPLGYVGAILKTFVEMLSQSRMMRGLHPNRTRGRKARREGGGILTHPRDEQPIRSFPEHDEKHIRSVSGARCAPWAGEIEHCVCCPEQGAKYGELCCSTMGLLVRGGGVKLYNCFILLSGRARAYIN